MTRAEKIRKMDDFDLAGMICDTMPGKVCGECQFRDKDTGKCHVMEWLHEEVRDEQTN